MSSTVSLPPVDVPDESYWAAFLGSYMHTGHDARKAVSRLPAGLDVAIDIETPSVTDSFTIKCVTAAWEQHGHTHAVLLDPLRRSADAQSLRELCARAKHLILHSSAFDVPGLVAADLLELGQLDKVMDTLIFARSAWPDPLERKSLEALADRVLGIKGLHDGLKRAQKASGLTSAKKWFGQGDIHMPAYRSGAMADTVVTLRLAHRLYEAAVERQLDHPFDLYGCTTREQSGALVLREQRVNRVMLRRSARGMDVDLDYLDNYVEQVEVQRAAAERTLTAAGLRPGVGLDIITHLEAAGQLPSNWPRTNPTKSRPDGTLRSDQKSMERLPGHPLADAHQAVAHTSKVLGYMEKVAARSRVTGRLHPQFNVLGASATGRLSVSEPELHQFPDEARPIILGDSHWVGLSSIDYSSIEPALLGWVARDWEFIDPFEAGADIYEPVMNSAGCTRKVAKVIVLAGMYGQGRAKLAVALGISEGQAATLQDQMRRAMPIASRYMQRVKQTAAQHGMALTVSGRVLPVPRFNGVPASYKAVNFTFQGSCWDSLCEVVLACEDAGIADEILLTMHDEILCSIDAAEEIQHLMSTPSNALITRAGGRVPLIRTDRHDMKDNIWRAC